jgi:hypothetical protein
MEGREQTAKADEVVSVLDIVRIPVVFSLGGEEPVLEANFLYSSVREGSWLV